MKEKRPSMYLYQGLLLFKPCCFRMLSFPDRSSPIGCIIDGYLRKDIDLDDHSIHLMFSANR